MALGFRKHVGGDTVKFGFYWNLGEWEAQIVPAAGGELKGTATDRYLRLPLLALLVIAPLMGAAYAFFLPFIGFAMVAVYLMKRVRGEVTTTTPPAIDAAGHTHGGAVPGTKKAAEAADYKKAA
jgi:hypothetical protein